MPAAARHAVVVLAERRRQVHDARAVLRRDEVVGQDRQRARLAVARREDRSLVGAVARHQLLAAEALEHLGLLAQHRLDAIRGQHDERHLHSSPGHRSHVGETATATLPGSVHGVVVHTSRRSSLAAHPSPATASFRYTLGSTTSL